MAYKGWYVCDVCGLEVSRNDKEVLKSWMDVTIHDHAYWNSDDDPELDLDVCSGACTVKAIRGWLDEQTEVESTAVATPLQPTCL